MKSAFDFDGRLPDSVLPGIFLNAEVDELLHGLHRVSVAIRIA